MKKCLINLLLVTAFVLSTGSTTWVLAEDYNSISPQDLKTRLDRGDIEQGRLTLFSTQTEKEYAKGFLPTAIPTFARPLESKSDYRKLDPVLAHVKGSDTEIVIICPRGGSGARRAYDYFKEHGIEPGRMLLLEGGQEHYTKIYPQDVMTTGR